MTKPLPVAMLPAVLAAAVALLVAGAVYHALADPRGAADVLISLVTGIDVAAERALDGDLEGALRALARV